MYPQFICYNSLVRLNVQIVLLSHCIDTLIVQLCITVWLQELKHNLAGNTIQNSNLLSDTIDSNLLLH